MQAVRICPNQIHPRFRLFDSVVKLTSKCNMIDRTYFAVPH